MLRLTCFVFGRVGLDSIVLDGFRNVTGGTSSPRETTAESSGEGGNEERLEQSEKSDTVGDAGP